MKTKHLLSICAAGMLLLQPSVDAFAITPKVKALVALAAGVTASAVYLNFIGKKTNIASEALKERAIGWISKDLAKNENIIDDLVLWSGLGSKPKAKSVAEANPYFRIHHGHGSDLSVEYKRHPQDSIHLSLTLTPAQKSLLRKAFPTKQEFPLNTILTRTLPNDVNSQEAFDVLQEATVWNLTITSYHNSPENIRLDALKLANRFKIPTFLTGIGLGSLITYAITKS